MSLQTDAGHLSVVVSGMIGSRRSLVRQVPPGWPGGQAARPDSGRPGAGIMEADHRHQGPVSWRPTTVTWGRYHGGRSPSPGAGIMEADHRHLGPVSWRPTTVTRGRYHGGQPPSPGAGIMEADHRHQEPVSWRPTTVTWGRYHGGRPPSSNDSFHSPTVIPPSALDKPSIMKSYHRRQTKR